MNPIFEATNNQNPKSPNDIVRQFGSFKQDPFGFMMKRKGINIPQAAVQYLLNSGQMSQEQLTYIQNVAHNMGIKF